jgi:hypothetical protein
MIVQFDSSKLNVWKDGMKDLPKPTIPILTPRRGKAFSMIGMEQPAGETPFPRWYNVFLI